MASDPVTAGLSLADKLFSFFTGEKWDAIRKRREGERLRKDCDEALASWNLLHSPENWKAYKDAEQKLVAWSNAS